MTLEKKHRHMKKNLLTIAFLSLCSLASAQLTYVGNAALVHIQDKALVYSGGGVKLDGTAKVNTIGDFMVVSSTQNFEVASTADFRLRYSSPTVYGQLYINNMPQANITGKVFVQFVIEKDGSITNAKIARSASTLLDAEALRIVNNMPQWIPGKQRGKAVRVAYTLPISFSLE